MPRSLELLDRLKRDTAKLLDLVGVEQRPGYRVTARSEDGWI
jgi:hypothetical protein